MVHDSGKRKFGSLEYEAISFIGLHCSTNSQNQQNRVQVYKCPHSKNQ